MRAHGRTLLHVAHHWSMCHDDALDAYQRALEIFLRRADSVDPATEVAWLKVVVKHEAMAIRRARSASVSGEDVDLDATVAAADRSVDEQIASGERVSRSAEALRALKPDEARALMLKAEGLSYAEIGERCGWTYTKVNRAITEGRRRFMKVYAEIESGEECDRFAPILAALAAGTASSAEVLEIRPHLRHCIACRATVRDLHLSRRRRAQLLLPPVFWAGTPEPAPPDLELVLEAPGYGERLKHQLVALLHRVSGSDLATGVHIASSGGGGGRLGALAAVLGFCLSGVGAGAICVMTGVLPDPVGITHEDRRAPRAAAAKPTPSRPADPRLTVIATPVPTPPVVPVESTPEPQSQRDRRSRRGPESHEDAPISPAPKGTTAEFSPEQSGPLIHSQPAAAPATGGGEFTP